MRELGQDVVEVAPAAPITHGCRSTAARPVITSAGTGHDRGRQPVAVYLTMAVGLARPELERIAIGGRATDPHERVDHREIARGDDRLPLT